MKTKTKSLSSEITDRIVTVDGLLEAHNVGQSTQRGQACQSETRARGAKSAGRPSYKMPQGAWLWHPLWQQ